MSSKHRSRRQELINARRLWKKKLDQSKRKETIKALLDLGISIDTIAEYLERSPQHLQSIFNEDLPTDSEFSTSVPSPNGRPDEKVVESSSEKTIELNRTRIKSLDELVAACNVDLNVWQVKEFTCNKWEMGAAEKPVSLELKNSRGGHYTGWQRTGPTKIIVEPLYQVKARFVRIDTKVIDIQEARLKALNKLEQQVVLPFIHVPSVGTTGKHMYEISLADHHFAKLGWDKETGWESYDSEQAEFLYGEATASLLDRASGYDLEKILFVVGHDLLNCDNLALTTTSGTVLNSTDTRYEKMFELAFRSVTRAIESCRRIAPVEVYTVRGNHDYQSVYHIGHTLKHLYANHPDVKITNAIKPRNYYQYNRVMLGLSHGNDVKENDYLGLMAVEAPRMWADTIWREFHLGHLHKTETRRTQFIDLQEYHGFRVRRLPSLCGSDQYHSKHGFVGNIRSSEALMWHPEGLAASFIYSIPNQGPARSAELAA